MIFTKLINKILGRKEGTHPLDFTKKTAAIESKPANEHVEAAAPKAKKPRAPRKPKAE
jgi:hypothetical protein